MANDADFELLRVFTQTREAPVDGGFSASVLRKIDRARRAWRWRRILVMLCIAIAASLNAHLLLQQAMQSVRWVGDLTTACTEFLLTPWGWAASMLLGACVVLRSRPSRR